jgi:hypothetical protein
LLCKELFGARWDRQLLGWTGLSQRGVGDRGGIKWTRDGAQAEESSDTTNFPLSKEQAPNRLAKGRTVLAKYRNKQQRACLWENAEGLGVIDMNRLPENALHPTRRGPM